MICRAHHPVLVADSGPLRSMRSRLYPALRGSLVAVLGLALSAPSLARSSESTLAARPARYVPELVSASSWNLGRGAGLSSSLAHTKGGSAASAEGKAHVFTLLNAHPVKILYFHGAGQPAYLAEGRENELVRRLAGALKEAGVPHELHALAWETRPEAVAAWLKTAPGRFVAAGHGQGASFAARLAREQPTKFVASFLISPSAAIAAPSVPTLVVRGSEDASPAEGAVPNLTLLRPRGADHSLRHRPFAVGLKQKAARSEETRAMNLAVAGELKRFLAAVVDAPRP